MHFSILLSYFYALLKECLWNSPQPYRYDPLGGLHIIKTGPLDILLQLGEKKNASWCKVRKIGRLFQQSDVLLVQELPDAQNIGSRCLVLLKQPKVVLQQFLSLLAHCVEQTLQDLSVDLLTD